MLTAKMCMFKHAKKKDFASKESRTITLSKCKGGDTEEEEEMCMFKHAPKGG